MRKKELITGAIEKTRLTTCEFFRVNYGILTPTTCLLDKIVQDMMTVRPEPSARQWTVKNEPDVYRMQDCSFFDDGCRGSFVRLRVGAAALKSSIHSDKIEDIELAPHEKMVEYYSFRFFKETNVIVMQRNRDAGTPNQLANYLHNMAGQRALLFEAVLNNDALHRLNQPGDLKRAELKFAVPTVNTLFDTENKALSAVIDLGKLQGAEYVTIIFSKGRYRGSMNSRVKEFLTDAINDLGKKTKKDRRGVQVARVQKKPNDIEPDQFLDLITDRMLEPVVVQFIGESPTTYDFYRAIETAYQNRREEIIRQFPVGSP